MQGARNPRKVKLGRQRCQIRGTEYFSNRGFLPDAEFNHQMTACSEQVARLSRNGAVGIEAVGAAIQRDAGIVPNFGWQRDDMSAVDVGRIADDEIEGTGKRRTEIADCELCA